MDVDVLSDSAELVRKAFAGARTKTALVLGSGWQGVADAGRDLGSLPYAAIPCLGAADVAGHRGQLIWRELAGSEALVFEGRRHWYEGCGWEPTVFPAFLAAEMGCTTLLSACAAGAVRSGLEPGDWVAVEDHINAMGANPLAGRHDPRLGARFPIQARVYTPELRDLLVSEAARLGRRAHTGVYAAVSGPTYETPAEARALRALGADMAGMSLAPEAMLAHARGLRVAGLVWISNRAGADVGHDDVLARAERDRTEMRQLVLGFLEALS